MMPPFHPQNQTPANDVMDQFEEVFGPFDPPPDYQFEPEFKDAPPRRIPSILRQGRLFRRRRQTVVALIVTGIVLLICSEFPIMRAWGLIVPPLEYLDWIAAGLLTLSVLLWLRNTWFRGPLVYVEQGVPIIARIADFFVHLERGLNDSITGGKYVAVLQHVDPSTAKLVFSAVTHEINACFRDLAFSFQVGDYVTAVYLRSNPEKSLQLYGFLDLRPNLGIIESGKLQKGVPLRVIGCIGGLAGIFLTIAWNIYGYAKFEPLKMSYEDQALPFALGAVLLGGPILGCLAWLVQKERRRLEAKDRLAAAEGRPIYDSWRPKSGFLGMGPIMNTILLCGAVLVGGGTMLCWAFTINAMCDSSKSQLRPVRIIEIQTKTHHYLFREYDIRYEFTDEPISISRSLLTTPWEIAAFGNAQAGSAHVRRGFFGWPWVEKITPKLPNAP